MKPFTYRFERKLSLSKQEEQAAVLVLQKAIADRDKILEDLEHLKNRIFVIQESIRKHTVNPSVREVVLHQEYLPVLKERFVNLVEDLQRAETKVDQARKQLIAKNQETKTFEKLKDRDWQDYLYEMNREDQKVIDELAITSRSRDISKGTGSGL